MSSASVRNLTVAAEPLRAEVINPIPAKNNRRVVRLAQNHADLCRVFERDPVVRCVYGPALLSLKINSSTITAVPDTSSEMLWETSVPTRTKLVRLLVEIEAVSCRRIRCSREMTNGGRSAGFSAEHRYFLMVPLALQLLPLRAACPRSPRAPDIRFRVPLVSIVTAAVLPHEAERTVMFIDTAGVVYGVRPYAAVYYSPFYAGWYGGWYGFGFGWGWPGWYPYRCTRSPLPAPCGYATPTRIRASGSGRARPRST